MTTRILVGVDGSPHSLAALAWAADHARKLGGRVIALFAWEVPFLSIPGAFDRQALEVAAKQFLVDAVASSDLPADTSVSQVVAEGDPTEALVAGSEEADLLVLGTRGRGPFAGLILGSVSQGCAAGAACPVVIVKSHPKGPVR